jgi:hypothetical protein
MMTVMIVKGDRLTDHVEETATVIVRGTIVAVMTEIETDLQIAVEDTLTDLVLDRITGIEGVILATTEAGIATMTEIGTGTGGLVTAGENEIVVGMVVVTVPDMKAVAADMQATVTMKILAVIGVDAEVVAVEVEVEVLLRRHVIKKSTPLQDVIVEKKYR